jgi:hypothetical protein
MSYVNIYLQTVFALNSSFLEGVASDENQIGLQSRYSFRFSSNNDAVTKNTLDGGRYQLNA